MTVAHQQDIQLDRRLQQDSIQFAGKTVYINPFLYWRRFDSNTDRWLREPGQLGEDQISLNRGRFYPELDWALLDESQRDIKDAAVEMFLKSLELIGTFHPELTAGQLLEVERKMAVTKKQSFERWVEKSFRRRFKQESRERKRFARERFLRSWREWFSLETTHHAVGPMVALLVLAGFGGWSMGMSQTSCPTLLIPSEQTVVR
ncbi:conserved hypothetical protein [Prochlorococcus marinus str. MIT 9313]|uniref:Uncharacterized protein n=1 Tax=Prochlorococcus marinus (strain MIT 9313) TaxID=74547 RepID=Q7V9A8_PROMM|nr:hypothetical protein [Prochlorococcus marinus]CAE20221.1 conserved hypothetical protein [Prochlorococcus marinus str. MIT 9313]